jgi:uncharacterized protein YdcH (DUF465 family)
MEASELELIARLAPNHDELRHLVSQHHGFESTLSQLAAVRNPSETERREIAKVKRMKLKGKDRISQILRQHSA